MIVKTVQRRFVVGVAVFAAMSAFMFAWIGVQNYGYAITPAQKAAHLLARAESSQTPEEVIEYVKIASQELPEKGSVSWWSSERGDFESIQLELKAIILRAENLSRLDAHDEAYVSEMHDIHSMLDSIQEVLVAF